MRLSCTKIFSHQLQTPLVAIQQYLSILQQFDDRPQAAG